MGERYSFYIPDDQEHLIDFVEEVGEDAFGSNSQMFRKSIALMKQEKEEEIRALLTEEDENTIL